MMKRSELFSDIRNTLPELERINRTTHAGLWLDKYMDYQNNKETEIRPGLVKEVSALPETEAYKAFYHRWEEALANFDAKKCEAEVKGRMIVGLGSESVLETSVTLHHTYGVPYIPGSALKGLAASYAHKRLGDKWKKGSEAYKVVFGDTNNAGYIIFFDALYIPGTGHKHNGKMQMLYPDVITVHHQKYFQETENALPADWDSPNPVPFLSATGKYLIALAAPALGSNSPWLTKTFEILEHALRDMGIGAKTSSGYGRMALQAPPIDPDIQKAEAYINDLRNLPANQIAGRLPSDFYPKWQGIKSHEARLILAKAIMETVHRAGREKASAGKSWYEDLKMFLGET